MPSFTKINMTIIYLNLIQISCGQLINEKVLSLKCRGAALECLTDWCLNKQGLKMECGDFHKSTFSWMTVSIFCFEFHITMHHNGWDRISNHQPHDCLLNRLFRRRSRKTSKPPSLAFVRGIRRWPKVPIENYSLLGQTTSGVVLCKSCPELVMMNHVLSGIPLPTIAKSQAESCKNIY